MPGPEEVRPAAGPASAALPLGRHRGGSVAGRPRGRTPAAGAARRSGPGGCWGAWERDTGERSGRGCCRGRGGRRGGEQFQRGRDRRGRVPRRPGVPELPPPRSCPLLIFAQAPSPNSDDVRAHSKLDIPEQKRWVGRGGR